MTKIALVSMVKENIEQLTLFIDYHLNIGINEIMLFFDDPEDPAIDFFLSYPQITIIRCTPDYWLQTLKIDPSSFRKKQWGVVNEGMKIAKSKNCDWMTYIDADELIFSKQVLKDVLEDSTADGLIFDLREAISERENYANIFLATYFKKKSPKWKIRLAQLLGCQRSIFFDQYLRGHTLSKMVIRLNGKIIKFGVHRPVSCHPSTVIQQTQQIKLLHHDCVGFNSWDLKLKKMTLATPDNLGSNRFKQLRLYQNAAQKGEAALHSAYKRLYILPFREKVVLSLLGMVSRIKVSDELFKKRRSCEDI